MSIVARPIRYTDQPDAVVAWAQRLGMSVLHRSDSWTVLTAGSGRLAVHTLPPGDPAVGSTSLAFETDDLDALAATWQHAGLTVHRAAGAIPLLLADTPFGGRVAAGGITSGAAAAREPDLAVEPMLVTSDVEGAARWFASWGLQPRIVGDRGGWTDLTVPDGGLLAVHGAGDLESAGPRPAPVVDGVPEVTVSLNFEHPDVDGLAERLLEAGLPEAPVHDEAYNRTVILTSPDGDEVWVNGVQSDLYGYHRA